MRTADRHSPPECVTSLLDIIPDAAYFIDTAGRVQSANEVASRQEAGALPLGADLARLPLTDLGGATLPYESSPFYRSAQQGEVCREVDLIFPGAGGTAQAVRVSSTPVRENGVVGGALVIVQPLDPPALPAPDLAERNAALQALNNLAARLLRINTTPDVYETALDGILGIMGARRGAINLADDARREFHLATHRGYTPATRRNTDHMPYDLPTAHNTVRESGEIVIIHPDRAGQVGQQVLAEQAAQTAVLLPFFRGERVIGVISYLLDEYRECTPLEREILRTAATYVGAALERAQLYEAAEAERTRLARILEHLPVGVLIGEGTPDPPTIRFTFSNETVHRQYSRSVVAPGAGHETFTIVHPDGRPYTDAELPLQSTLWTGQPAPEQELVFRYQDGTERVFLAGAALLQTGATTREAIVVTQEITARKQVEAALRDSARQFRAVFDNTHDVLLLCDDTGRYVNVNTAACALFGQEREALLGHQIAEFADYPGAPDMVRQSWQAFLAAGHDAGEFRIRRPDGTHRDFEYTATAHVLPGLHLAAGRDITERKQAEAALRQSEERFAKAFHSNPDPLNITRLADDLILDVNARWLAITGYEREEVVGHTVLGLNLWVHPAERAQISRVLREHGAAHEVAIDFRMKSGVVRHCLLSVELIELEGETCALSMVHDVTERKRLEEQVRQQAATIQEEYERLATLVANINVALALLDEAGCLVLVNDAWLRNSPYTRADVLGRRPADLFDQPGLQNIQATIDGVLASGEPVQIREWHFPDGAGGLYIDGSVQPIRSPDGAITGVLTAAVDVTEKVLIRQQIEAQRTLLETIFESTPVGIILFDREMRILDLNTEYAQRAHLDPRQVRGRTLYEIAPDARQRAPIHQRVLAGEVVDQDSVAYPHRDGTLHYHDIRYRPVRGAGGTISGILSATSDVTEKVRAQQQIEAQRALLETIVASLPVGIAYFDHEMRYVNMNSAWALFTGLDPATAIGQPYYAQLPPAVQWPALHPRMLAGEVFDQENVPHAGPDGTPHYYDVRYRPVRDAGGAVSGLLTTSVDVTEKVLSQEEIENQRALLETIIEANPVGMAFCDRELRLLNCNAAWAAIVGLDPAKARGRLIYKLVPAMREQAAAHQQALAGEDVDLFNVPFQPPGDADMHYYDLRCRPVHDMDSAITGLLIAAIDVTERHELDRQKDDFIALASHELKTPITAIKGYAQTGLRIVRELGDERLIRTLRIIDVQSNRLTRLIDDLLDVSRMESSSLTFYQEPFDLRQLVHEVAGNLQLTAPEFAIDLRLPTTPVPVNSDHQRIEQVVTNLVQNAIKYSGSSRRIEVSMTRAGAEVVTSVRDFGVGIPTEQQGRVFERFFRASNVSARHYSGLGLGLFISAGIVARHGGRIWVESAEGQGSIFYFALPLLGDEQ